MTIKGSFGLNYLMIVLFNAMFYTFSADGMETLLSSSPLHFSSVTRVTTLFIALVFFVVAEMFWFDLFGDAEIDGTECATPFIVTSPILTDLPFLSVTINRIKY